MNLTRLLLVTLTVILAVSTVNAQSKISAFSEYESHSKGSNPRKVVDELELEYEIEEGGLLVASRTTFAEFGCNSSCTMEILPAGSILVRRYFFPGGALGGG